MVRLSWKEWIGLYEIKLWYSRNRSLSSYHLQLLISTVDKLSIVRFRLIPALFASIYTNNPWNQCYQLKLQPHLPLRTTIPHYAIFGECFSPQRLPKLFPCLIRNKTPLYILAGVVQWVSGLLKGIL